MPYLVEIIAVLVSVLIKFLNAHGESYIEKLFGKLGQIISNRVGEHTAVVIVSTEPNVYVEMDNGDGEILKRLSDEKGHVEFKENLRQGDTVKLSAYGGSYCPGFTEIVIDNTQVAYCVVLKLKHRKNFKEGA